VFRGFSCWQECLGDLDHLAGDRCAVSEAVGQEPAGLLWGRDGGRGAGRGVDAALGPPGAEAGAAEGVGDPGELQYQCLVVWREALGLGDDLQGSATADEDGGLVRQGGEGLEGGTPEGCLLSRGEGVARSPGAVLGGQDSPEP